MAKFKYLGTAPTGLHQEKTKLGERLQPPNLVSYVLRPAI
jgi:hypothetical protein